MSTDHRDPAPDMPQFGHWSRKPVVAVTRPNLPGERLALLDRHATIETWADAEGPSSTELMKLIADADAVLTHGGDKITAKIAEAGPMIRVFALPGVGHNNVDVASLNRIGVGVSNTPDVLHETTADLAWTLILSTARRTHEGADYVKAGKWIRNDFDLLLGRDVSGATLGIIGYGQIGRAVAHRGAAFNMNVIQHSRTESSDGIATWVPLDSLLEKSDIVTLHVPLIHETEHMIGERELALMKPSAILVNTARGSVINEIALLNALQSGQIFGAGLDVLDGEPISDPNHPLVALDNCIVLPHLGSATLATRTAMVDLAVANIVAALEDRDLLTPVGLERPWVKP